mmetsp:Transcript_38174/g.96615  ORF Transcript_38174/g.96615 Transcript_38174/m.96615 type:complete len:202 (-) Transcript_38174:274-879(-)|eukprot:CAMPEP_0202882878 /NCGR_PEP_ID=MMETSP1391-20130828/38613_1 /ASSEMBLY_ACC=CAM_ASM_000867 /TAXON_ID=1034604 /ORGANISM="Chlamydomonas leiostraca, Strain SAG 11-49" /LENGTH=201 /DNA_ID=CAMNT_0049565803 /DNA_START=303 /DNA_END=908 /DNA_ORIENTATION=-
MGAQASRTADEGPGIVTVHKGPGTSAAVAAKDGMPAVTDPQALATLAALADLRPLVPELSSHDQELLVAASTLSQAGQLAGQLGDMVAAHHSWSSHQVAGVVSTQKAIHSQIDRAEALAGSLADCNKRAANDMQALDRQLLHLSQLAADVEATVAAAQATSSRLAAVRASVQAWRPGAASAPPETGAIHGGGGGGKSGMSS